MLLADIGGTNVRFATLRDGGHIDNVESWLTALYPDIGAAVKAYADTTGLALPMRAAAVCAAGPLVGGRIDLTNCAWNISVDEIATATGAKTVVLVNDFAAVGHALPVLTSRDVLQIGGAQPLQDSPMVALGPGTGLGVASVIPDGRGGFVVAPGEGGHADLAATNDREIAIVHYLIRQHGHVSSERVLSGPGLETLYGAIAALDGLALKGKPIAADIAQAARAKSDAAAVEAVGLFTGWLGAAAGNLALVLGAQGGVYVAGGIVPAWGELFDGKLFRRHFEAKGRMKTFLAPIPAYVVTAKDLAFRGLAELIRVRTAP